MRAQFIKGQDPKKTLDVGIERSTNTKTLANQKSVYIDKTNEEFLNGVYEELIEFWQNIHYELYRVKEDANHPSEVDQPLHPLSEKISSSFGAIINELENVVDLIQKVKLP